VLHSGRRADVSGVGIGHVASRTRHGAVLVRRRHVVVGAGIGGGHVVGRIHWLADMRLRVVMVAVMAVVVGVGWRVVLGPAAAARQRTAGGCGTHVSAPLHLLPSRQMPPIVHHAGVGCVVLRCGCCGSCSPNVRATAASRRESEAQQRPGSLGGATRRGVGGMDGVGDRRRCFDWNRRSFQWLVTEDDIFFFFLCPLRLPCRVAPLYSARAKKS